MKWETQMWYIPAGTVDTSTTEIGDLRVSKLVRKLHYEKIHALVKNGGLKQEAFTCIHTK